MVLPPLPIAAVTAVFVTALVAFGPRDARDERQQAAPKEGAHEPLEHLIARGGPGGESFG